MKEGAVSFISSDKKHDNEQIRKFKQRFFEKIREKVHPDIKNWARFSDGCSTQFKSQHCVGDLFNNIGLLQLTQAFFHYFESHEGKNSNDTTGSANKCHFCCTKLKNPNITARTANDLVNAIKSEIKGKKIFTDSF